MDYVAADSSRRLGGKMPPLQATGSYIDSATNQKMGFNLIYHVLLDASPAAGSRIESLSKQHFAASAFR